MFPADGTTLLPWLVVTLLSLGLLRSRLRRNQALGGVGPRSAGLFRPAGALRSASATSSSAEGSSSREQVLGSFELALGRLPSVTDLDRAATVLGLGGRSHIEHDHQPTSPMARLFADLLDLDVHLELEAGGQSWAVEFDELPERDHVAIRAPDGDSPGGRPRLGVPVALHIRVGGTSLEGLSEVTQGPDGRLLLALPQTLHRFEQRSWRRAGALEGMAAKLDIADGCGSARAQIVDVSEAGLLVRISDSRVHLMAGWRVVCTVELLGKGYTTLTCEVRHFDAETGLAGLLSEDRPGDGALERLCGVIEAA